MDRAQAGALHIGQWGAAGLVTLESGSLESIEIWVGSDNSDGGFVVNSGTVTVTSSLNVGAHGNGSLAMNGGTINTASMTISEYSDVIWWICRCIGGDPDVNEPFHCD